jgi:HSP20 family molecular chaperone IbpA
MEIKYGPFDVELPIVPGLDYGAAQATYDDGFLRLELPKRLDANSSIVTINITDQ